MILKGARKLNYIHSVIYEHIQSESACMVVSTKVHDYHGACLV